MDDRRQFPRIPFTDLVMVQMSDKPEAILGRSADLSARGISLQCELPLWPGQRCLVEFKLPIKKRLEKFTLKCEAWHCGHAEDGSSYRIGMLFVEENAQKKFRAIEQYIQSVPA